MAGVKDQYKKETESRSLEEDNRLGENGMQNSGQGSKHRSKRKGLPKDDSEEEHGICYLSRVPPRRNPSHIRLILYQYGEIQRLYLASVRQAKLTGSNQLVFEEKSSLKVGRIYKEKCCQSSCENVK